MVCKTPQCNLEIRVFLETGRVEIAWQNGGVVWTVALYCIWCRVCTNDDITSLNNNVLLKHKVKNHHPIFNPLRGGVYAKLISLVGLYILQSGSDKNKANLDNFNNDHLCLFGYFLHSVFQIDW